MKATESGQQAGKVVIMITKTEAGHKVNRWHIQSKADAIQFLTKKARNAFKKEGKRPILVIGADDAYTEAVRVDLAARGMRPRVMALTELTREGVPEPASYAGIVCTYTDIRHTGLVARHVLQDPMLGQLTFECVTFPRDSYTILERHTVTTALDLVSPLPGYPVDVLALYEESLTQFEKKCDVRDFMDLCQLLKNTIDNGTGGDIAEFGSFRGHSGYLMATLLEKLGADQRLYLFDTFTAFPEEAIGIDQFWSRSHPVDFDAVRTKFKAFPFVRLVQGDFTRTFDTTDIRQLALVHVDCDAYRSTDYLIRRIYPEVLAPGGIMVFEDYGHAQLLGSRVAVDQYFSDRSGCITFFSQFSGSYVVIKLHECRNI
jgi:O-methyltransferase